MTLFLLGLLLGVAVGALGSGAVARARLLSRLAIAGGPYRTKLDVVQEPRKKVYCKECKHFGTTEGYGYGAPFCRFGDMAEGSVKGVYRKTRNFVTNKNYDCKDWEKK